MIDVTDGDFYEQLGRASRESPLTAVYFTAPWCGPCRMLKPTLEKLEAENEGLTILRVDADTCTQIAIDYQLMTVPQVFFYSGGVQVEHVNGVKPKPALQKIVDAHIG